MRVQDSYSTEEVNTGKTWIDGKPIYRKVLQGDIVPTNGTTAISNVSTITNQYSMILYSGEWQAERSNAFQLALKDSTHNAVYYFTNSAGTSYSWFIVVEYTKTTD